MAQKSRTLQITCGCFAIMLSPVLAFLGLAIAIAIYNVATGDVELAQNQMEETEFDVNTQTIGSGRIDAASESRSEDVMSQADAEAITFIERDFSIDPDRFTSLNDPQKSLVSQDLQHMRSVAIIAAQIYTSNSDRDKAAFMRRLRDVQAMSNSVREKIEASPRLELASITIVQNFHIEAARYKKHKLYDVAKQRSIAEIEVLEKIVSTK